MAIEMLIRLVTTPAPDGNTSADRLRGSIVSVKPYPNPGWGAGEQPPTYGVIRVLDAKYEDFEMANQAWRRDWTASIGTAGSKDVIRIAERTPILKVDRLTPLDLGKLCTPDNFESVSAVMDGEDIVVSYIPKSEDARQEFLDRVDSVMSESVRKRRYRVQVSILRELDKLHPGEVYEVQKAQIVDDADDTIMDKPKPYIQPITQAR